MIKSLIGTKKSKRLIVLLNEKNAVFLARGVPLNILKGDPWLDSKHRIGYLWHKYFFKIR